MKKLFLMMVMVVGLITGFSVISAQSPFETEKDGQVLSSLSENGSDSDTQNQLEISEATEASTVEPITPTRLRVPKIGINSQVEYVGLDAEGRMDVPKADENVAWFELGVQPGEKGSAVLAGHYDSKTGGPAVFYDLTDLQVGDMVEVTDEQGKKLQFVVTETATYKDAEFPIDKVFAQSDTRRLNLITCAGQFSQSQQNYSDRFVVFTELAE